MKNVSQKALNIGKREAGWTRERGKSAVIVIILFLIIIGALVYFFMTKGKPTAAYMEVLPQDCVMLMQVDMQQAEDPKMRDDIWKNIKQSSAFKEKIAQFEKEKKIDLDEDIFSWLGDQMTVSLFSVPKKSGSKADSSFAVLFTVKDLKKAEAKTKELTAKSAIKYKEEKYQNVAIMVPEGKDAPTIAFVKSYLVLGNSPDDLKKCIDASTGKDKAKSLKDNAKFRAVLKRIITPSVALMYIDPSVFAEAAKEQRKPNPEAEKMFKAMQGIGLSAVIRKGNVIGKGFVGLDPKSDSPLVRAAFEMKPNLGSTPSIKLFPADTSLYIALDIKQQFNMFAKSAEQNPDAKKQLDMIKQQMKSLMDVDLEKDIIDNLAGEAAIAVDFSQLMEPGMGRRRRQQVPPVVFALKVQDQNKIKGVVSKILAKAPIQLTEEKHEGVSIHKAPEDMGSYAIYQDYFILGIGSSLNNVKTIITNKMDEGKSLASTEGYKLIKDKIVKDTTGIGVIKLEKILPMLEMGITMAAAQKGADQAEAAKSFIDLLKKYNEAWYCSNTVSDGGEVDFIILKTKEEKK